MKILKALKEVVLGIGVALLVTLAIINLFGWTMTTAIALIGLALVGFTFSSRREDVGRISSRVPMLAKVAILVILVGLAYPQIPNLVLAKDFWGPLANRVAVVKWLAETPFVAGAILLAASFIVPAFLPQKRLYMWFWAALVIVSFLLVFCRAGVIISVPVAETGLKIIGEAVFLLLVAGLVGFMAIRPDPSRSSAPKES